MASDGPGDGLRVLSLDGPPFAAAALSEPLFLQQIAHRWAFKEDNEDEVEGDNVRVSDMFDVIGGCGKGGLYAILFARLNLTVGQVLEFHKTLQETLFAADCWTRKDQIECIKAFDNALDEVLARHRVEVDLNSSFFATDCKKCFLVVLNEERASQRFLRSYRVRASPSPRCTIRQALHATLADVEHLPAVPIGDELFIGTSKHISNPARILSKELAAAFPALHLACFVSLGADHTLPPNNSRMIGQDLISQFRDLNCFFRLSVKEELRAESRITSSVVEYLQEDDVSRTTDEIVKAIQDHQPVVNMLRLGNLAGEDGRNELHRKVSHICNEGDLKRARQKIRAPYDFPPIHEHGCLEGTREDILQPIERWADDVEAPNVFWLEGYPGTGKTAISMTLKQRLAQARRLGASCFFRREDASQHNSSYLFRSIASQLVDNHEFIRGNIVRAVNSGAVNLDSAPAIIFETLLCDPLAAACEGSSDPFILVLDAMDEFGQSDKDRLRLVKLLLPKWIQLPRCCKLLITSRSQGDLPLHLDLPSHVVRRLEVGKATSIETRSDIRYFFEHNFDEIRSSHPNPRTLVTSDELDELVNASAGLFIWASTVVEMVRKMRRHVRQILHDLRERRTTIGETQMDALYHLYLLILQPLLNGNWPIVRFLSAVICARTPLPAAALSPLCDLDADVIEDTTWHLGPVMDTTNGLRFVHKSFVDYIISQHCPVDLTINNAELMLGVSCINVMIAQLHFNMGNMQSSHLMNSDVPELLAALSEELRYASRFWGAHLMHVQKWDKENVPSMSQSIHCFFDRYFLYWVETVSILGCFREACEVLRTLRGAGFNKEVNDFGHDALIFLHQFVLPISQSYPQIYISALPWAPTNSVVRKRYLTTVPHALKIVSNGDDPWPVQLPQIQGHTDDILSVAFSPNGSQIVSGSKDHTIRIWDASTRQPIGWPLHGHKSSVHSVAFSFDGSRIVSGSSDKTIRIWDAATRSLVGYPLRGHSGAVLQAIFSPDGSQIASVSNDKTVRIWDTVTRRLVGEPLQGNNGAVHCVAFSPDGSRIVSGSSDKLIRVWNAATLQLVGEPIKGHGRLVYSVAFSPDGSQIISGSSDKTIRIWDAATHRPVGRPLRGHSGPVLRAIFSPDGSQIASVSNDKTVRIWDTVTHQQVGEPFQGHQSHVNSVSYTPGGDQIVSASNDKTIRIWDTTRQPGAQTIQECHGSSVRSVAFSPDGSLIASGSADTTVRFWDAVTHQPVGEPVRHGGDVYCLAFSPDGSRIVTGSTDEAIQIWNSATHLAEGRPLGRHTHLAEGGPLRGYTGRVNSVAFSPDGCRIVSAGLNIQIWDATTGILVVTSRPISNLKGTYWSTIFSPDGSKIISRFSSSTGLSSDDSIQLLEATTLQSLGLRNGRFSSIAFSPDSSRVVSGHHDGTVQIWDAATLQRIGEPFRGHNQYIPCVAYSPNGSRIVSGSCDNTIRIWNCDTHQPVGEPLRGHTNSVISVAFSPDGCQIVSGSEDKTIRIWNVTAPLSFQEPGQTLIPLLFPCGSHSSPLIFFLLHDGWVIDQYKRHLLWIPQHLHDRLPTPNLVDVIGPRKMIGIDASDFRRGTEWTSCIDNIN